MTNIFEKNVLITGIRPVQKVETGELMYQVIFSEHLKSNAITPSGKKTEITIPATWFTLNIEAKSISQYPVGSIWKITILENNTITIVELK